MKKRKLKDLLLEEMRRRHEAEVQLDQAAEGMAEGVLHQHDLAERCKRLEARVPELEARAQGLVVLALSAWNMIPEAARLSFRGERWKSRAWELGVELATPAAGEPA